MNGPAALSATVTTRSTQNAQAKRPIALWVLTAACTLLAVAVLLADSSVTAAQRIALLIQSGTFP
jgi:hypothetical protein